MTLLSELVALIPAGYVIGSIPFGLLVGLSRGKDPRQFGSGNIGATNVARLLGVRFFFLVFFLDLSKGLFPVLAAGYCVAAAGPGRAGADWFTYLLWLLVGFSAILGHMLSLFLRFKGGKGVATSAGVVLGLWPYYTGAGLAALGLWIVLFALTRYVSLASMIAAAGFAVAYVVLGLLNGWPLLGAQWPLLAFAVLVAVMIVYKHRDNIARLRLGTESRFARKRRADPAP